MLIMDETIENALCATKNMKKNSNSSPDEWHFVVTSDPELHG